ncbi:MAG: bifunctional nuclease family protein [Chitinophagales bacterium]|nr:bifunctional nuclease family protein [Chitinophagales bacterium]
MADKVQLEIVMIDEGVSLTNSYTVLMQEKYGQRKFVIVIGYAEAQAIATSLEKNFKQKRPLTHDLFYNITKSFNIEIIEVNISNVQEGIFYSTIVCKKGDVITEFDSRTSDALALSLRFNCPIYIGATLLNEIWGKDENIEQKTIDEFQDELDEELKDLANLSDEEIEKAVLAEEGLYKKTKKELEKILGEAIEKEDYELAARVRDELDKRP